jgi:hypothetical protein
VFRRRRLTTTGDAGQSYSPAGGAAGARSSFDDLNRWNDY